MTGMENKYGNLQMIMIMNYKTQRDGISDSDYMRERERVWWGHYYFQSFNPPVTFRVNLTPFNV